MRSSPLCAALVAAALTCACGGDRRSRAAQPPATTRNPTPAAAAAAGSPRADRDDAAPAQGAAPAPDSSTDGDSPAPPARARPVHHLATPDPVRGLYVSRAVAQGAGVWQLIDLARRTSVNTFVIDVKDEQGLLLYPSTVGLAHLIGADTVHPMPVPRLHALMDSLRRYRIYAVARIVVARDPVLAAQRPQWAVVRRSGDTERNAWVDPRHREVWAYAADLASEAAARGFSAVQFDDVRFPASNSASERVEFTFTDGRTLSQVVRAQLAFLQSRLAPVDVPMAIAVSGLAAVDSSDLGIGQRWEAFIDHADVVNPVEFPSRFPGGTFGLSDPSARPYDVVKAALAAAVRRTAAVRDGARLVPWYQDFPSGAAPWGEEQVRAQMRAGEESGIRSWLLWNSEGRYTASALRPPARRDTTKTARPAARAGARSRH